MRGIRRMVAGARVARRNGTLARVLGAYATIEIAEYCTWIVLLVYAYQHQGATGTTVVVLVQLVPAIVLAPWTGTLADRRHPGHVLRRAYALQAAAFGAMAATAALSGPVAAVYTLAAVATLGLDLVRPSQAALLPSIVRTPRELTTANVVLGWVEGVGWLLGPLSAGVALALGGIVAALCVGAAAAFVSVLLLLPGAGDRGPGPAPVDAPEPSRAWSSVRAALAVPAVRVLVAFNGFFYLLTGALDILCVVLAVSVLHSGDGAAGYLNAAIGGGAAIAGVATVILAGRPRLAPVLAGSVLLASGALVLIGVIPSVDVVVALLAVIGIASMVFFTVARTLLQRAAPPHATAISFAAVETVMNVGIVAGALVVRGGIAAVGARDAVLVPAALGVLLVMLGWRSLRSVDAAATIPQVEIRLLRSTPIFASLSVPTLEAVARRLEPVVVRSGGAVVREGEAGDAYYVVADGSLAVTRGGTHLRTLGVGSGFGEIALLARSYRTATVRATIDSLVYALDGDVFVSVLTGRPRARDAVRRLVASYGDTDLEGPGYVSMDDGPSDPPWLATGK
ncbi:MAG: cyclic nucleotide-binding domain-containing protein [Acidimicrobiales bacterium]